MSTNTPQNLFDNLDYLNETKNLMRQAIENKGQEISDNDTFRSYAIKISNIQSGGGGGYANASAKHFNSIEEMNNFTTPKVDDIALVFDMETPAFYGVYRYNESKWEPAPTQFDATDSLILSGIEYYGPNGISTGTANTQILYTGSVNTYVNDINNVHNAYFSKLNVLNLTTVANLFANYRREFVPGLMTFNNKKITNASHMFYNAVNLLYPHTTNLNTIREADYICYNCSNMTVAVNLTSVYNADYAFYNCSNLTGYTYSMALIRNAEHMFENCTNLKSYTGGIGGSAYANGGIVSSFAARSFYRMFHNCINLEHVGTIRAATLNRTQIYRHEEMFLNCPSLTRESLSNIVDFLPCYEETTAASLGINTLNYYGLTESQISNIPSMAASKAVINGWNVPIVIDYNLPTYSIAVNTISNSTLTNFDLAEEDVIEATSLKEILSFITSYKNDANYLKITNTGNIVNVANLFVGFRNLHTLEPLDFSSVENAYRIFQYCNNLSNINLINANKLTNVQSMFHTCPNLTSISEINTANADNMSYMFLNCFKLTDVQQFNTSNTNRLDKMFMGCNNLSDAAIQNIVNMALNSIVAGTAKNLSNMNSFSPFNNTNISFYRFENRLEELDAAGWSY